RQYPADHGADPADLFLWRSGRPGLHAPVGRRVPVRHRPDPRLCGRQRADPGGAEVMEAGVISRRNVIIGLGCAASAGTAYAMTPRKRVSLMGPRQLDDLVPTEFGDWVSRDVGDALALN